VRNSGQNRSPLAAYKTSSELPFLAPREDIDEYAFEHPQTNRGHRSWTVAAHLLSGETIAKLSLQLQTGNQATTSTDGPQCTRESRRSRR